MMNYKYNAEWTPRRRLVVSTENSSVEDGSTNVFITETYPFKSYPRFSTYLVKMEDLGIKMI